MNLSILIIGVKETKKDSLSSCEWKGNSPNLETVPFYLFRLVP